MGVHNSTCAARGVLLKNDISNKIKRRIDHSSDDGKVDSFFRGKQDFFASKKLEELDNLDVSMKYCISKYATSSISG